MICARPTLLTLPWASVRVLMSHAGHSRNVWDSAGATTDCNGFIKGPAPEKMAGCEDDFAHLLKQSKRKVFLIHCREVQFKMFSWKTSCRLAENTNQGFSHMGIQASYGQLPFKEYCFVFHMLLHKLSIWAGPIQCNLEAHFSNPG